MNEGIKENNIPINVLQALGDLTNGAINYHALPKTMLEEQKIILNYITKLQEENLKLKEINEEHRKINGQLQEENKFLKDYKNAYGNVLIANKMLEKENQKLVKENDIIKDILNKLTELKGGSDDVEN